MAEWNIGEKQKQGIAKEIEEALIAALMLPTDKEIDINEQLDELDFLAETAGAKVVKRFVQKLSQPDSRTYLGKGKIEEIALYVESHPHITMVIFNDDLSGKQVSILEETMKVKILDRSSLILDIFASRAQTAQAKTQVELAQMEYLLPRLRGLWSHLERQRGGIGMRGPGEKEIETDRRIVRDKIAMLKKKLEKIDQQNLTQRKQRESMVRVSLVGYTNVGKSTLLNLLSKAEVFAENKLFATLDTTVRKVVYDNVPFLLSDTVGFIRKLPHHLVESFKSTLDEVRESDILLHVVDVAHPAYEDHIKTVRETLHQLNADGKPTLYVFNKMDLYRSRYYDAYLDEEGKREIEVGIQQNMANALGEDNIVFISAISKENIDVLRAKMMDMIREMYEERYPHQAQQW
jgi:GTP-binding protein HflX